MRRALIVEFGLCGIGHDPGPPLALRLWVMHVTVGRRGMIARLASQQEAKERLLRVLLLITRRAAQARANFPASEPIVVIDRALTDDIQAAIDGAARVAEDSS